MNWGHFGPEFPSFHQTKAPLSIATERAKRNLKRVHDILSAIIVAPIYTINYGALHRFSAKR